MNKRIIALLLIICISLISLTACSDKKTDAQSDSSASAETDVIPSDAANPVATLTLEDGRTITIELYYNKAPNTVKNFIYLVKKGFYDGLIFHRVVANFVVQGGCPEGTGFGNPGYSIKGEFSSNGFDNDLPNKPGYVAMARASYSYDTAGSQFYINVGDNSALDGDYCVFGYVTDGMDIVNELSKVATDAYDKPLKDIVIKSITVDTGNIEYGEPETLKK